MSRITDPRRRGLWRMSSSPASRGLWRMSSRASWAPPGPASAPAAGPPGRDGQVWRSGTFAPPCNKDERSHGHVTNKFLRYTGTGPYYRASVLGSVADPWLWIWIWISGSMPPINGSGSCHFVIDLQDAYKKQFFFKFYCLFLFEGTFFKVKKKSQRSRNQGFFTTIFAWW